MQEVCKIVTKKGIRINWLWPKFKCKLKSEIESNTLNLETYFNKLDSIYNEGGYFKKLK